jgi:hypothetical protein
MLSFVACPALQYFSTLSNNEEKLDGRSKEEGHEREEPARRAVGR